MPRRPLLLLLLATVCAASGGLPLRAQTVPEDATALRRVEGGVFSVELPTAWRELTPPEALRMREQLPFELQEIMPGRHFVYGDVERWLRDGFDGRSLLVVARADELPVDAEVLERIEQHWDAWRGPNGERREVIGAEVGTVGTDQHPALILDLRLHSVAPAPALPMRAREYYASSTGQQLILSFRAWEDDWTDAEPLLRRMAASLTFARPPREPARLGDRLLDAGLIGGFVGVVLLLLRWRLRRPQGPPAPGSSMRTTTP